MTVVAIVPALVALGSALLYLLLPLAAAPKTTDLKELARIAFAMSFLVFMLSLAGHVVRLG